MQSLFALCYIHDFRHEEFKAIQSEAAFDEENHHSLLGYKHFIAFLSRLYLEEADITDPDNAHSKAMELYSQLNTSDIKIQAVLHLELGFYLTYRGKFDEAKEIPMKIILTSAPEDSYCGDEIAISALEALGVVYFKRGQYDLAEKFCHQCFAMCANTAIKSEETYVGLFQIYLTQNRLSTSEKILQQWIRI